MADVNYADALPAGVPSDCGRTIVPTAPLTETIDHAGYFIQTAMASLRPLRIKSRRELLETVKPRHWRHLQPDNGDLPVEAVAS